MLYLPVTKFIIFQAGSLTCLLDLWLCLSEMHLPFQTGTTVLDSDLGRWTSVAMGRFQRSQSPPFPSPPLPFKLIQEYDQSFEKFLSLMYSLKTGTDRCMTSFSQQVPSEYISPGKAAAITGAFSRRPRNYETSNGGQKRESCILDLQ